MPPLAEGNKDYLLSVNTSQTCNLLRTLSTPPLSMFIKMPWPTSWTHQRNGIMSMIVSDSLALHLQMLSLASSSLNSAVFLSLLLEIEVSK